MTRGIKASEVREGMEVEWSRGGITYQMQCQRKVEFKRPFLKEIIGYNFCAEDGGVQYVSIDQEVTVLSEPAPEQPEEPTEFGARVVMNGRRFLRAPEKEFDVHPWLEEGEGFWLNWDNLCRMGPVTVIPDQGWTVSDDGGDNQEVPERIEVWPEYDESLRKYKWLDRYGTMWHSERHILDTPHSWVTRLPNERRLDFEKPTRGPWTRIGDA